MSLIVYVITHDPKERCELVSSVFAQALTALAFDYKAEIFILDNGVKLAQKGYIEGLKAESFEPLSVMIKNYLDMGGLIYICHPSAEARKIEKAECITGICDFVNASKLLERAKKAAAVFTY